MVSRESIGMMISGLGIVDTLILLDETYNNSGICGESSTFLGFAVDCGYVLQTSYSKIFGQPLSLFGFFFYISMFTMFFLYNQKRLYLSKFLLAGSIIGLLASVYFVYLQLSVIGLICLYCMGSALTSTLLFILMLSSFKIMSVLD